MSTGEPDARRNLLVWCLNETFKNGFHTFPKGVGVTFDTALLSAPEVASGPDVFKPRLIEGQGYSARRLPVANKRHLDVAIETCEQLVRDVKEKYGRIVMCVIPFWYRMAMMNAINRVPGGWDTITAIESPYLKVQLSFIKEGDGLLKLPVGVVIGDQISKRASGRGPEEQSKYLKMPPSLQYLRKAPKTKLEGDQEAPFYSSGGKNVNWRSFKDAGFEDEPLIDEDE